MAKTKIKSVVAWGVFRGCRLLNHLYRRRRDAVLDSPLEEDVVRRVEVRYSDVKKTK